MKMFNTCGHIRDNLQISLVILNKFERIRFSDDFRGNRRQLAQICLILEAKFGTSQTEGFKILELLSSPNQGFKVLRIVKSALFGPFLILLSHSQVQSCRMPRYLSKYIGQILF